MEKIKNDKPTYCFSLGSVLYGDIDDLIAYLALIPDEGRMVKMWERALDKRLDEYRRYYSAVNDFKDSFDEPIEVTNNVLKSAGRDLIREIDEVRNALDLNVREEFVKRWEKVFNTTDNYDMYALRAICGKRRVGKNLFMQLSDQQVEYLFEKLKKPNKYQGKTYKGTESYISGELKHFKALFDGKGVVPGLFKQITWEDNKQVFRHLVINLKHPDVSQAEMIRQASNFFIDKKGNPYKPEENRNMTVAIQSRIEEINEIIAHIKTISQ